MILKQIKSIFKLISVFAPKLSFLDRFNVFKTLFSNQISGTSPVIKQFEEEIAKKFDRKYAVALTNGSAALDVALQSVGLKKDDEVIVPSFAIISCLSAIVRTGATPIFCDVDMDSWNMSLDHVKDKVTPNTKAVLMVHLYGLTAEAKKIEDFCKDKNFHLIEDAAEAHGQSIDTRKCGSFGNTSTFSFYANKHITTGEGGMILTDDYKIAEKCKSLRNLCFQTEKRFIHEEIGFNFRMTNIQAALGLAQLEQLDYFVKKKKEMGRVYSELLSNLTNLIQIPIASNSCASNIYWVYGIVLKSKDFNASDVAAKLKNEGIGTRPFFYPMHNQPVFKKKGLFIGESYRNSEIISKQGLYLPSGMKLSNDQIYKVAKKLKNILIT